MSDAACIFFQLPSAILFNVTGADSLRYLNARLSNDIKLVTPEQCCKAAALTAQGKTELICTAFQSTNNIQLLVDCGDPDALLKLLLKFKVADRVDISRNTDLGVLHIAATNGELEQSLPSEVWKLLEIHPSKSSCSITPCITALRARRLKNFGLDIVASNSVIEHLISELPPHAEQVSSEKYHLMRHQHGQPVVGDLPSEFFFPELQLDDAVSHRKGCYVGQEAVEMVRSRGKLPAKIMRAQIQGIIETGNHIIKTGSDETVGSVVSIALDHKHNTTWSFARIRKYADLPSALFLDTGAQVELTEIN